MPTRTYYGKLDCYSSAASIEILVDEMYKGCMDFLSYITGSNEVELVTWNSGSGVSSATFDNRTYLGGSFPFGSGSFSLWKFKANSRRNWDWYLYLQRVANGPISSNTGAPIKFSWTNPITGSGGPADGMIFQTVYGDNSRGILMQAATCVSGTTSFNPWNGSISAGSANASTGAGNGGVRWISGSNNHQLYVLPRSNNIGGNHNTQKSNGVPLMITPALTSARYHFMYDGDAFQVITDTGLDNSYTYSYVGAYELRQTLSGSGLAGSNYGFVMYAHTPDFSIIGGDGYATQTNTLLYNSTIGSIAGNAGNAPLSIRTEGGIVCPVRDAVSGSKGMILNILNGWSTAEYQPNTYTNRYEEFPILIGASESPFLGFVGTLNTGLVRAMRDVQVHDTTADFNRAVFAGTTTPSNLSISTPWAGTSPPGLSTSRTGSQFTWTKDYG